MARYIDPNTVKDPRGYIVGSSEAPRVHGMNTVGKYDSAPRFKNQFFVHFQFAQTVVAPNRQLLKDITYKVISFDAPKFSIDTETLMQYNKRRVVPTKIQFDPCNITWHDDKDALIQDFWKFVYEFYFKDGRGKDPAQYEMNASTGIVDGKLGATQFQAHEHFGYHLAGKEKRHNLFRSISLYLVANEKYTRIDLVNPYMVSFAHDSLSQESHSEHASSQATFVPESVVYVTENEAISSSQVLQAFLGTPGTANGIFNHYNGWDSRRDFPGDFQDFSVKKRVIGIAKNLPITSTNKPIANNPAPDPLGSTASSDNLNALLTKWSDKHPGFVAKIDEILNSVLKTIADDPAPLASGGVNSSGFTDQVAVHTADLASEMIDTFEGTKETEQVKAVAKAMVKAVAEPSVDTFGEMGSATAAVADPGAQVDDFGGMEQAISNTANGTAIPGDVGHQFANAITAASNGVVVSGNAASLMGGTVPSTGIGTLSGISRGGLLPQGSVLGQSLQALGALGSAVSVITGGGSFGKFSTGATQLGSVVQSLATGNLRQAALTVGTTNHFSPNVEKAINIIDVVRSTQRVTGNNLNNSVVSSSQTSTKPWVNPDTIGTKNVNTTFPTVNGRVAVDTYNEVFGPPVRTQNKNIQPW